VLIFLIKFDSMIEFYKMITKKFNLKFKLLRNLFKF
jgi:hypothetical protein